MSHSKSPPRPRHGNSGFASSPLLAIVMLLLVILVAVILQLNHAIKTEMNTPFAIEQPVSYELKAGRGLKQVAAELRQMGLLQRPLLFTIYGVINGAERSMQQGQYRIVPGDSPRVLLQRVLAGDVAIYKVTFPEGILFTEALDILRKHEQLTVTRTRDGAVYSTDEIMSWLGQPGEEAEGWFYPDTYNFPSGTSDLQVLRMANDKMKQVLAQQWEQRPENSIYDEPYQVLVMASIIQSEGIYTDEFPLISGVFNRRLDKKIPLYSDPTVVYAHGADFTPPLLRRHTSIDSPYNTYRYGGLPPTPICLPATAAIAAALNPAEGDSLYFVALGNGRHHFSTSLKEHNQKRLEIKKKKREQQ